MYKVILSKQAIKDLEKLKRVVPRNTVAGNSLPSGVLSAK